MDRVADIGKDEGDGLRHPHGGAHVLGTGSKDQIDVERDEPGGESPKTLSVPL